MNVTAVAVEDLKGKGLKILEDKFCLTCDNACPDTFGISIGRRDVETGEYESFFKEDFENGNIKCFDEYKEKCNLYEKREVIHDIQSNELKRVVDYYIMYDIKESSKNRPTETMNHVDTSVCVNGYYSCEYELLFAYEGNTRRIVVPFSSNNIPMHNFISMFEDYANDAMDGDYEPNNPFKDIIEIEAGEEEPEETYYGLLMFDAVGEPQTIEFESVEDFLSMLVSVRLLSCTFVERKNENGWHDK